jgi:hypothetical protein
MQTGLQFFIINRIAARRASPVVAVVNYPERKRPSSRAAIPRSAIQAFRTAICYAAAARRAPRCLASHRLARPASGATARQWSAKPACPAAAASVTIA